MFNRYLSVLCMWISLISGLPEDAQEPIVCQPELLDLATVILPCPFSGAPSDVITVYDRARELQPTQDWKTMVNFDNSIWVFDAGAEGNANLIIDFQPNNNGSSVAYLYDDQNGDGKVDYWMNGRLPIINESNFPTVTVTTLDGSWWVDNHINYNLDITIDGQVRGQFGTIPESISNTFLSDGFPEYALSIRDTNHDGHPDYQFIRSLLRLPASAGILRFEMTANPYLDEPPPVEGAIFWYYLGNVATFVQEYGQSFAPIQIDWNNSRILQIAEFVASRSNDHNWFIYSNREIEPNTVNPVNFENPFMFYDLANDDDGYPELEIRQEYTDLPLTAGYISPISQIRYSWDQDNNTSWDYKLELAGRVTLDTPVEFPEFSLLTIPYEEMPAWVTERAWDSALFIAVEGYSYWTSEGIYEWPVTRDLRGFYLQGIGDTAPLHQYRELPIGMRGELNLDYTTEPRLYISPIDGRLHLLAAMTGFWNIDGNRRMIYTTDDNSPYFNRWTLMQGDYAEENLIWTGEYLVFGDSSNIILRRVRDISALNPVEVQPPRVPEERILLETQLKAYQDTRDAETLQELFEQFDGIDWHIDGASLRDFRLTEGGFIFTAEFTPESTMRGALPHPDLENLQAGRYVIQVTNDSISILPYRSPVLRVVDLELSVSDIVADHPVLVSSHIHNSGTGDATYVNVRLYAENLETQEQETIANAMIDINGQTVALYEAVWDPNSAGEWQLVMDILGGKNVTATVNRNLVVDVDRVENYDLITYLSLDGNLEMVEKFVPLLIIIVGLLGMMLFALIIRTIQQGAEDA